MNAAMGHKLKQLMATIAKSCLRGMYAPKKTILHKKSNAFSLKLIQKRKKKSTIYKKIPKYPFNFHSFVNTEQLFADLGHSFFAPLVLLLRNFFSKKTKNDTRQSYSRNI
jgi:hypothetical protein